MRDIWATKHVPACPVLFSHARSFFISSLQVDCHSHLLKKNFKLDRRQIRPSNSSNAFFKPVFSNPAASHAQFMDLAVCVVAPGCCLGKLMLSCLPAGTMVVQVAATDADDPTYGNSARVVYSIIHGQPYFSVEPKTGWYQVALHLHRNVPLVRSLFFFLPDKTLICRSLKRYTVIAETIWARGLNGFLQTRGKERLSQHKTLLNSFHPP